MNRSPSVPTRRPWRLVPLAAVAGLVLLAACGDDDSTSSTEAATAAPDSTAAPAVSDAPVGSDASSDEELCQLATQMAEGFPTDEQLARYQELAPAEISDAVDVAVPALSGHDGDVPAFFIAYADDDVEAAIAEINAWETEHCGIPHDENALTPGASREVEDGATRVDVTATDYAFSLTEPLGSGRTSFVLTNQGQEAHFLGIAKLAPGVTLDQAMQSDDDSMIEGFWQSGIAAPGGSDDEAITFDLEPGTYGLVCFVSAADGTPHAMLGMAKEITVS